MSREFFHEICAWLAKRIPAPLPVTQIKPVTWSAEDPEQAISRATRTPPAGGLRIVDFTDVESHLGPSFNSLDVKG